MMKNPYTQDSQCHFLVQLIYEYKISYTNIFGEKLLVKTLSQQLTIGNHRFHLALDGIINAVELTVTFRYLPTIQDVKGALSYIAILDWSSPVYDAFVTEVQKRLAA